MNRTVGSGNDDLRVELNSYSLLNRHIEVIVSGSIAAVESVRFVRALRRLGARTTVLLTAGAEQFITKTSLEWASGERVQTEFGGLDSHLANAEVCVVAPCSSSLIGKVAHGITDSPAATKIASYLGSKRPVMILPAMHDSLRNAPATQLNLQIVAGWAQILPSRDEEGKQKFPDPLTLADEVAHRVNRSERNVVVTMGSTRGYIDDVRYVSNYSTGATGSAVAEELYRNGYQTHVVSGPAAIKPATYSKLYEVQTHAQMSDIMDEVFSTNAMDAGIFAASVLDFQPEAKIPGKLSSKNPELVVRMLPTSKLIERSPKLPVKIAFKLEVDKSDADLGALATQYATKYGLTMVVSNLLKNAAVDHRLASIFSFDDSFASKLDVHSNRAIAEQILNHLNQRLASARHQ